MPDTLTQIEVTTRRYIDEQPKLRDLVFNKDPLMSFLDENCLDEVEGGSTWNDNVEYDVQDGGSYAKGQDLPADQRQIEQQLRFDPKFQTVLIPFYKEDIKVLNSGPLAVVKLVEERVDSAYMQLGAQTAIQLYMQGQNGNYVKLINGLLEALSGGNGDAAYNNAGGVGWDGAAYALYGTLTRATYGGRMFAPCPYNFNGGNITLPVMETMYQSVNYGSGEYEPNIILTTAKGQGYIRQNYQTQQRFQNVTVGKAGFRGLEYNGATILASRYAPGTHLSGPAGAGTNDRVATRYLSYTTGGLVAAYPVGSLGNSGESIWFMNARKPMIKYRISKNSPFNGSLDDDGFIPSAGNTKIVGKILLAHNLTVLPGYHCYGYGFVG